MIAAAETRSTLTDGTRLWHIVQTDKPLRAPSIVADVIGDAAVVELTGTTFHAVADGLPSVMLVHRSDP